MGIDRIKGCRENDNPYAFYDADSRALQRRLGIKNELVNFGDTVDTDIEVRSGTEGAFVEEVHTVLLLNYVGFGNEVACVVNVCLVLGEVLTVNREGGAVEYLERAVVQLSRNLVELCLRACCSSAAESGIFMYME